MCWLVGDNYIKLINSKYKIWGLCEGNFSLHPVDYEEWQSSVVETQREPFAFL